jgi:tetratricopeptide (TPR) repeat protein
MIMYKIIVSIFLVLTFFCSCSERNKTAADWSNKAVTLWVDGKYTDPKKAIEYLNNAIKLQQNNADYYNKRGTAYYDLGQYQRAIEDYNQATDLDHNYIKAYYNRGTAYYNLGQNQLAIKELNEAIRLKPDYVDAYDNRGVIYLLQGNKELGCRDVKKACELGECKKFEVAKGNRLCR